MNNILQHTINKVFVEVQTSSKQVAEECKNSIENFLQKELFPQLETLFENKVLLLEGEMVQVEKMNVTVDVTSGNFEFNFHTYGNEIQTNVIKELTAKLEDPEKYNLKLEKKPVAISISDSFFYFLENGALPWWNSSGITVEFSKDILLEITKTSDFEYRLLKVLRNPSHRKRLIQQFLNDELEVIFLGIQYVSEEFVKMLSEVSKSVFNTTVERYNTWDYVINSFLGSETKDTFIVEEQAFFQFLINGVTLKQPEFSINGLKKLTQSPTFEQHFVKVLHQESSRVRLIHQFSNETLHVLCTSLSFVSSSVKVEITEISDQNYTSIKEKQKAWNLIIAKILNTEVNEVLTSIKEQEFFQFLSTGTSSKQLYFSIKFLQKITKAPTFERQFLTIVGNESSRIRLIHQFSNEALHVLCTSLSFISKEIRALINETSSRNNMSIEEKLKAWDFIIIKILTHEGNEVDNHVKEEEFFHFLRNGVITKRPFFSTPILKKLPQSSTFKAKFIKVIQNEHQRTRLIHQFSTQELLILFGSKIKASPIVSKSFMMLKEDSNFSTTQKQKIWNILAEGFVKNSVESKQQDLTKVLQIRGDKEEAFFNFLAKGIGIQDCTEEMFQQLIQNPMFKVKLLKAIENKEQKERLNTLFSENLVATLLANKEFNSEMLLENHDDEIQEKMAYLVKNVGLILLHPFLKQFFSVCGFLNDKNEIIKPTEAIHTLHYIATKKEKQLESSLVFEKFLCGIPVSKSIARDVEISSEIKENAEELITAVAQNWEVLKKSSNDLIRNEFLQRSGKLDLTKDNPYIIVEQKTQDILLEKLPWGIAMCKLPWIKSFIEVQWESNY